jgi:hypothetical protein
LGAERVEREFGRIAGGIPGKFGQITCELSMYR